MASSGADTAVAETRTPWLPLLAAVVFAAGSTVAAAFSRGAMYARSDAHGPYTDVGFSVTPDWGSAEDQLAVELFCCVYGVLVVGALLLHPMRWVAIRRGLFVLGLSQFVIIGVQAATVMPDPNPEWRYGYAMYPAGLSAAWAYVFLYLRPLGGTDGDNTRPAGPLRSPVVMAVIRWITGFLCLFGLFLTLASRAVYTVDLLSIIAIVAGVFLWWEWSARSEAAVRRLGHGAQWFEQDVLAGPFNAGGHTPIAPDPHQLPLVPLHLPAGGGENSSYNTPRGARDPVSEIEARLVLHVHRSMPEWSKRFHPAVGCAAPFLVGMMCGLFNYVSAAITDGFRPLGRPAMPDFLFEVFDAAHLHVPARTADIGAFVAAGLCFLDVALLQPFPLTAVRRLAVVWGTCFALRFFFVTSTYVMDPYIECRDRLHPHTATCGDCIFSGHTCTFLSAAWTICAFRPSKALRIGVGVVVAVMLLLIVMTRLHYTRDVTMAVVVFGAVQRFWSATVFQRPDRAARSEAVFSFECDYYVARERVVFGYPIHATGGAEADRSHSDGKSSAFAPAQSMGFTSVEDDAPTSLWEALHWRRIFRLVRPTGRQSPAFRALLRAPLTEAVPDPRDFGENEDGEAELMAADGTA